MSRKEDDDVIDAEVGPGDDTPIKARKKIPQKMVDGFLASGMRETKCSKCGCRLWTREPPRGENGADLCPTCAGILANTETIAAEWIPGGVDVTIHQPKDKKN